MANRYNTQFVQGLEKKIVNIFAKVAFGAAGAPTLSAVNSKGILSITQNGTGDYTFVFGSAPNGANALDVYVKILGMNVIFNAGSSLPAAPVMSIKTNAIATAGSASINVLLTTAGGGSVTNPADGEIGYFQFVLGDSTAQ